MIVPVIATGITSRGSRPGRKLDLALRWRGEQAVLSDRVQRFVSLSLRDRLRSRILQGAGGSGALSAPFSIAQAAYRLRPLRLGPSAQAHLKSGFKATCGRGLHKRDGFKVSLSKDLPGICHTQVVIWSGNMQVI
jgi:hypothetical protein